ncbi:uncharacterized protein LOC129903553 [Solanum dulcamara]|uniref:uncharacterized protein LOC129903553 n=1 Tax=Solanum dulcamara TaxID=45834 RepID=UPI0024853A9F|nr:uncharacterized protein LOC129903553 [Solanum dulcamara]
MAKQSDKVIGESKATNAASHAEITLSASAKRRRKRPAAWDHFAEVETSEARFSILAEMTCDALAVPILSIASKSAFSTEGRLLDSFRSSLTPNLVQALVCLQDWLRSKKLKQSFSVEEDLDNLEQLEQGELGRMRFHKKIKTSRKLFEFILISNGVAVALLYVR